MPADEPKRFLFWLKHEHGAVIACHKDTWREIRPERGGAVLFDVKDTSLAPVALGASIEAAALFASTTGGVQVQVFRYDEVDDLPINRDDYVAYESLGEHVDVNRLISDASTTDSDDVMQFIDSHVFLKKLRPHPTLHHQATLPSSVTVLFPST